MTKEQIKTVVVEKANRWQNPARIGLALGLGFMLGKADLPKVGITLDGNQLGGTPVSDTVTGLPARGGAAPEVTVEPTVTPVVEPRVTPSPEASQENEAGFVAWLSDFVYTGEGSVTNPETPFLFDAISTGKGETHTYDIGVKEGQFAVIKGYAIKIFGQTFGGEETNGCAIIGLDANYAYSITVTDGRVEVYDLPKSDPTGWSKVLGEQAAVVENMEYACPVKPISEIPVFGSSQVAPNFNK